VAINIRRKLKHFEALHRSVSDYLTRVIFFSPSRWNGNYWCKCYSSAWLWL